MSGPYAVARPLAGHWATEEFGIALTDGTSPVGLTMGDLVQVGLRRNPRRAQLLVSTVLGKHLAADPRMIAGTGRLLGALVARRLAGDDGAVPPGWVTAARRTVSGDDPGALVEALDAARDDALPGVLTLGFAETATALGHLVADQLHSGYLHSTRRIDGVVPVTASFSEPHSHATGHLLRPDRAAWLQGTGPVVLVDDELSTGRTALNVIEALQGIAPRDRYVLAGLLDVRSAADDGTRQAVADRLRCRIDVVSVVRGEITVPAGTVERVATELDFPHHASALHASGQPAGEQSHLALPWPAAVPTGGRHGFRPADGPAFDAAVAEVCAVLSPGCVGATRVLVIGTEELMYLPLRIALELARNPLRQLAFQSTTRSPVHAVDRVGYPIRRRIDFRSTTVGGTGEPVVRHLYNAAWPASETQSRLVEADLIVLVDDGHALAGPTGVAAAVRAATGVPVLLAVVGGDR